MHNRMMELNNSSRRHHHRRKSLPSITMDQLKEENWIMYANIENWIMYANIENWIMYANIAQRLEFVEYLTRENEDAIEDEL
jgi:hypothetical protein